MTSASPYTSGIGSGASLLYGKISNQLFQHGCLLHRVTFSVSSSSLQSEDQGVNETAGVTRLTFPSLGSSVRVVADPNQSSTRHFNRRFPESPRCGSFISLWKHRHPLILIELFSPKPICVLRDASFNACIYLYNVSKRRSYGISTPKEGGRGPTMTATEITHA